MKNTAEGVCPLCLKSSIYEVPEDEKYLFCNYCYLIHLKPVYRKDAETEKNRYLKHQNDINDENYSAFLMKAFYALEPNITPQMIGLDFGCGPNPVLSQLLLKKGFVCENYDPFFYPQFPEKIYDYIFAIECFEHFYDPLKDMKYINELLKHNGSICIMTERWINFDQFKNWYYKRDYTHVSFFHEETFNFICNAFGMNIIYNNDKRIVVLQK